MLTALYHFVARRLQPQSASEASFRIDLTRSVNDNVRPAATLIVGVFFGTFALQWVGWPYAVAWALVIALYPIVTLPLRHRIFTASYANTQAGEFLAKAIALMMPLHVVWALYVPMCWVPDNAGNNAFLVIFLLAGLISSVQIYGPCIFLSLPALCIYLPVLATHFLRTGNRLDAFLPAIQILFCAMLALVGIRHYRTFRESVSRRLTIEALVKQLETARDAALAANKAKSSFLASMSHELRTPLNAIIGFSDMICQGMLGPVAPVKYGEYVGDIRASGVHLLTLIDKLLDLSKIEAGKRDLDETPIALGGLLEELAALMRPQADAAQVVVVTQAPAELWLTADERALRQILMNFLSNAIKYSRPGGKVAIFAETASDGSVKLGVEDHGIGMTEQGLRVALEPYSQLSHVTAVEGRGTGLGLPLARALIELHGATFRIESAPGRGTRVWGEFPAARVAHLPQAA